VAEMNHNGCRDLLTSYNGRTLPKYFLGYRADILRITRVTMMDAAKHISHVLDAIGGRTTETTRRERAFELAEQRKCVDRRR